MGAMVRQIHDGCMVKFFRIWYRLGQNCNMQLFCVNQTFLPSSIQMLMLFPARHILPTCGNNNTFNS